MMNKKTRRLSKMPEEVRAEIGPYFNGRSAITDEQSEKLAKPRNKINGGSTRQFIRKGLTVSFLDIHSHYPRVMVVLPCFCNVTRFLMWFHYLQQPKWNDLDVNQHVNNVKYIGWILEVVSLLPFIHV
jgi:fatty acyl-ACP thioesterase B